jgi:hypothetical protein
MVVPFIGWLSLIGRVSRLIGAPGREPEHSPQRAKQSRKPRRLFDEEIDDEGAEEDLLKVFELSCLNEVAKRRSSEMIVQNGQKQNE